MIAPRFPTLCEAVNHRPTLPDSYWHLYAGRRFAACQACIIAEDAPAWMWPEEDQGSFRWLADVDAAAVLRMVEGAPAARVVGFAMPRAPQEESMYVGIQAGEVVRYFGSWMWPILMGGALSLVGEGAVGLCAVRDRDGRLLAVVASARVAVVP